MAMNNKDRLIEAQHEVMMLSETVIKKHAEIERLRAKIKRAAHMLAQEEGKTALDVYWFLNGEDDG